MTNDRKSNNQKYLTGRFKGMLPKSVDNNVLLVVEFVKQIGPASQAQIASIAGHSDSWASMFLNEAVRRGLLIANKKRPRLYALPGADFVPEQTAFAETGTKESLTVYFDGSYCKKLQALSAYHTGNPFGGQGRIIARLIDEEMERLYEQGANLQGLVAEMLRHESSMARLRGKANAQSDRD